MIDGDMSIHVNIAASLKGLSAVYRCVGYDELIPDQIQVGCLIVHFEMYNVCVKLVIWGAMG